MNSCIYEGEVRHARYRPEGNRFRTQSSFCTWTFASWISSSTADGSGQSKGVTLRTFGERTTSADPLLTIDEAVRARLFQQKTGNGLEDRCGC